VATGFASRHVASRTSLHYAVLSGRQLCINAMIPIAPGLVEQRDALGMTPLALAVAIDAADAVDEILRFVENTHSTPAATAGTGSVRDEVDADFDDGFTRGMHPVVPSTCSTAPLACSRVVRANMTCLTRRVCLPWL
jgi:hypothetical protein